MGGPRLRFAPSPTGSLHLGNARTALFNRLLARGSGGTFVLRIEDTDSDREQEGSEEGIFSDLKWLGLLWDEGPTSAGRTGRTDSRSGPSFTPRPRPSFSPPVPPSVAFARQPPKTRRVRPRTPPRERPRATAIRVA